MSPVPDSDKWVDAYGDLLYNFAIRRVNDKEEARDLVQDTFMAALKAKESFKGDSSEKTWIIGILKHKIYDFYRNKNFLADKKVSFSPEIEGLYNQKGMWAAPPTDWGDDPEKNLGNKNFMRVLQACVDLLKALQKRIFITKEMDGQSTKEICKIFDITETNLNVILYRARQQLRLCLTKNWFQGEKSRA